MLRSRLKRNESDRFITARSSERDLMVEKFHLRDSPKLVLNSKPESNCNSAEPRIRSISRTPVIIKDEKKQSEKVYLSLLKTQLFKSGNTNSTKATNSTINTLKKKRRPSHNFTSLTVSPLNLIPIKDKETTTNDIAKKLNFNNLANTGNFSSENNLNNNFITKILENASYKRQKIDENSEINQLPCVKEQRKDFLYFDFATEEHSILNIVKKKKIKQSPFKVLDAPNLKDDFYLQLLDWGSKDILAVGLENIVYLWNAKTASIAVVNQNCAEKVTSVNFLENGEKLVIGLNSGKVNIIDIVKNSKINGFNCHTERVGVLTHMPNDTNCFSSGSQDHTIVNYDIRSEKQISNFLSHSQEVCGLKWSNDGRMLASGGNDNKLMLWTLKKLQPEAKFQSHLSAVKAIGWSYHKFGLLASGGGTQDRTIKFWNTNTMKQVDSLETTSQVCNIMFSKTTNEFITTHGYTDNFILLWDSEKKDVIASLKGHKDRVNYLAASPNGKDIVTGAGDETLRFWEVFVNEIENEKISPNNKLKKLKFR